MEKDLYDELRKCSYYTPIVIKGHTGTHKTINQYKILQDLGEGAFSVVKLAEVGALKRSRK